MVETRRKRHGKAPAPEAKAPPPAKRQRGDNDDDDDEEEKALLPVVVAEKRDAGGEASTGASLSDAARAAWDAFYRAQFFFQPPREFYALYALARSTSPENPLDAFVESAGVRLCGPFELLSAADGGKKEVATYKPLFVHGRFPNDPPEMLTALVDVRGSAGQHWGDAPEEDPRYVAVSPDSAKVAFEIAGSSLLQVLAANMPRGSLRLKVDALVAEHCGGRAETAGQLKKQREREATSSSLHGLGVVVPVNAKTETGFRELPIAGPSLASLLESVREDPGDARSRAKVNELITRATIASDECDFGTGLLLGLDLLTAGPCLQKEATQLLRVAYALLKRGAFFKIVKGQWTARSPVMQLPEQLTALSNPNNGSAPKTVALPQY